MIDRVIASRRSIEIDDSTNFKAFSVRIEGAPDAAALAELLGRIAVKHDSKQCLDFTSCAARLALPEIRGVVAGRLDRHDRSRAEIRLDR